MMVSVQSPQTVAFLSPVIRLLYVIDFNTLSHSRRGASERLTAATAIKWSTTMSTAQYVPYQAYKVNIDPNGLNMTL